MEPGIPVLNNQDACQDWQLLPFDFKLLTWPIEAVIQRAIRANAKQTADRQTDERFSTK